MNASYTYAVARPFRLDLLAGLRGVDGAPVRLVRHDDLVAVVSSVPDTGFDERSLEALPRLAEVARAHHAVVAGVAAHTVTLPCRLATIHRGDDRVVAVLRDRYPRLRAALDRLAGRVELGVKVYTEAGPPAVAASGPPAEVPAGTGPTAALGGLPSNIHTDAEPPTAGSPEAARSGRDYLRRRRAEQRAREEGRGAAHQAAERMDAELAALAADHRRHRPQDRRLSGAEGEHILNVAYLVAADQVGAFTAQARALAGGGLRVEVTGPWAPYSFAPPDEADEPAEDLT